MTGDLQAPSERHAPSLASTPQFKFVRCIGPSIFRNGLARDLACLLDVDDEVTSWSCANVELAHEGVSHVPDLMAEYHDGILLIDAITKATSTGLIAEMSAAAGYRYRAMTRADINPIRLRNAKDLLRYSRHSVNLEDRIRVLAALDECGTMTLAECLSAFRTTQPVPAFASLVLQRFISIDLDEAPIGPETIVRRQRG